MSKTYKFSPADGLPHRNLNLTNRELGKPLKKVVHHRERRTVIRSLRTATIGLTAGSLVEASV